MLSVVLFMRLSSTPSVNDAGLILGSLLLHLSLRLLLCRQHSLSMTNCFGVSAAEYYNRKVPLHVSHPGSFTPTPGTVATDRVAGASTLRRQ